MSKTHRKTGLTVTRSKVAYINDRLENHYCNYEYKRILTTHGEHLYNLDVEDHKARLKLLRESGGQPCYKDLREPRLYDYRDLKQTLIPFDVDELTDLYGREYDKQSRDKPVGYNGNKTEFKAHAAGDLRSKNRALLRKIIKGDESWEDKPFPDTYLGKMLVYDYF